MPQPLFTSNRTAIRLITHAASISCMLLLSICTTTAAQDKDTELGSPRATFTTFLRGMGEFAKKEDGERGREGLAQAVRCLDLSTLPPGIREESASRLAVDLKRFLDRFEYVVVEKLPDTVDEDIFVWRKPADGLEISLVRDSVNNWRFSMNTLLSLPDLLRLVRGNELVQGVEESLTSGTLADRIRVRMPNSLRKTTLYFENWQWIALILLVIIGILLERLVIRVIASWLLSMANRSAARERYKLDRRLIRPIGILAMAVFWSLLIRRMELPLQAEVALYFACQVLIAVSGVWAVYSIVDIVASYFQAIAERTESKFDDLFIPMIRRALKVIVIAFGVLFVADNFNIDITSLLAGLGIGGIALALAAKDTVENIFGSLTVLMDRPFEIGDWIRIGEFEGTVEDVGFRSTRIRTFYNSQISIPNANLTRTAVDNFGRRQYRRTSIKIGVQYDTPPERIEAYCEGIREIVRQHPFTRKDLYHVYFNEFADSSLNIMLYIFHEVPDWATELRERHRLFLDVVRLAHKLGIEFAFPTQTLHIDSMPPAPGLPPAPPEHGVTLTEASAIGRAFAESVMQESQSRQASAAVVNFDDPGSIQTTPATDGPKAS